MLFRSVFLVMPTVSSAYWILNVLAVELYLLMYVLLFASAIKLRYKRPYVERAYKVPGGNFGMWCVAGIGLISCVFTFFIGLLPPAQIHVGSVLFYVLFLVISILLFCFAPSCILLFKKRSWSKPLEDEDDL